MLLSLDFFVGLSVVVLMYLVRFALGGWVCICKVVLGCLVCCVWLPC